MIIAVGSKFYLEPLRHLDDLTSDVKYLSDHPENVSLVMFTGGEDVHPKFYNGGNTGLSYTNEHRDLVEKTIFDFCRNHNVKMTGVCRGFQFLNVMSGGFMYQHITGHAGALHGAYFPCDGEIREVSSTHHQLVGLPDDAVPIAWSSPRRSHVYMGPDGHATVAPEYEMESAIFPNSKVMGVQYHPEMLNEHHPTRIHYANMISDFMNMEIKSFTAKYGRKNYVRRRKAGY